MKVNNSTNLAAYISVNSDPGPDYGRMTVLRVPSNNVIQGPEQIANTFNSTSAISKDISLLDSGGSSVIHGNLLTLPIGSSFLYVEPLYVQASGANGYPILQRVLVAYGDKIGYAANLSDALLNLSVGVTGVSLNTPGSTSPPQSSSPSSSSPTPTPSATPSQSSSIPPVTAGELQLLSQLDAALNKLQAAYKAGDFAAVGQAQADVQQLTNEYLKARDHASPTPTPSGTK
jgi:uncharacterized membrane protein (UPF0182 family)